MEPMAYVHLLLFRCKDCQYSLALPVLADEANLERTDADSYVRCICGGLQNFLGVQALRHWVTPWHDQQNLTHHFDGSSR